MRLYRPVGLKELLLIFETGMTAFPPRLPEQPIFYPVLNAPYAIQIASRWNTRSGDLAGYVTQFDVDDKYAARFEPHIVGSREHAELWVPAEKLAMFNQHIQGKIIVIEAYFGEGFRGFIPQTAGNLRNKDAVAQFKMLEVERSYSAFDFLIEFDISYLAIFLHFPFWMQRDCTTLGITNERRYSVLHDVGKLWHQRFPDIALCYADYA
jgi:hypothetical protein